MAVRQPEKLKFSGLSLLLCRQRISCSSSCTTCSTTSTGRSDAATAAAETSPPRLTFADQRRSVQTDRVGGVRQVDDVLHAELHLLERVLRCTHHSAEHADC